MEKFSHTLRGYNPEEVNRFLDKVIIRVEDMIKSNKEKDLKIEELSRLALENNKLREKLEQYERMEETLNKTLIIAQRTSDQVRLNAHKESEMLVEDAKNNANRIVNDALLQAEKTENEAMLLRRNINIFKRRLKTIIEAQLEVIEEIEKVEI